MKKIRIKFNDTSTPEIVERLEYYVTSDGVLALYIDLNEPRGLVRCFPLTSIREYEVWYDTAE